MKTAKNWSIGFSSDKLGLLTTIEGRIMNKRTFSSTDNTLLKAPRTVKNVLFDVANKKSAEMNVAQSKIHLFYFKNS